MVHPPLRAGLATTFVAKRRRFSDGPQRYPSRCRGGHRGRDALRVAEQVHDEALRVAEKVADTGDRAGLSGRPPSTGPKPSGPPPWPGPPACAGCPGSTTPPSAPPPRRLDGRPPRHRGSLRGGAGRAGRGNRHQDRGGGLPGRDGAAHRAHEEALRAAQAAADSAIARPSATRQAGLDRADAIATAARPGPPSCARGRGPTRRGLRQAGRMRAEELHQVGLNHDQSSPPPASCSRTPFANPPLSPRLGPVDRLIAQGTNPTSRRQPPMRSALRSAEAR